MRIALDTGGTFTDCVFLRDGKLEILKVPSQPKNPAAAIAAAPFLHPRLAALAVQDVTPDPHLVQEQAEVRATIIARLQALASP